MARNILKPEYGKPLLMRLFRDPVLVEGKYGFQYQYELNNDEAICWLDPEAHEAIQATGAKQGDEIVLLKEKDGRFTKWSAQVVESNVPDWVTQPDPAEFLAAQQAADPRRRSTTRTSRTSAAVTLPPTPQRTVAKVNGSSNGNGNGHHAPAAPPLPTPAAPPEVTVQRPAAKILAAALCTAIDAAKAATEYAAKQGVTLKFHTEDIRALGITLYIEASKK